MLDYLELNVLSYELLRSENSLLLYFNKRLFKIFSNEGPDCLSETASLSIKYLFCLEFKL